MAGSIMRQDSQVDGEPIGDVGLKGGGGTSVREVGY